MCTMLNVNIQNVLYHIANVHTNNSTHCTFVLKLENQWVFVCKLFSILSDPNVQCTKTYTPHKHVLGDQIKEHIVRNMHFLHIADLKGARMYTCVHAQTEHTAGNVQCVRTSTQTHSMQSHTHTKAHIQAHRDTHPGNRKKVHARIETHRGQYALCRQASAPTHSRQCSRPAIKRRQAGKGGDAHPLFSIPSSYISSSSPS